MEGLVQLKKEASDRLLLIDYDIFVDNPAATMKNIESFLNLPIYNYDFENIESATEDDDLVAWGLSGMHKIRKKLEKTCKSPKEILGDELYNRFIELEKKYE